MAFIFYLIFVLGYLIGRIVCLEDFPDSYTWHNFFGLVFLTWGLAFGVYYIFII